MTKRGTRAGKHHQRSIKTVYMPRNTSSAAGKAGINFENLIGINLCGDIDEISCEESLSSIQVYSSTNYPLEPSYGGVNTYNLIEVPKGSANQQTMSIFSVNVQSAKNKTDVISELIVENNIDILALTETWLSAGDRDKVTRGSLTPPGYSLVDAPRTGRRGGGVAIIYKSSFNLSTVKSEKKFLSFEHMEILLKTNNDIIRIIVVYRPPSGGKSEGEIGGHMQVHQSYLTKEQEVGFIFLKS